MGLLQTQDLPRSFPTQLEKERLFDYGANNPLNLCILHYTHTHTRLMALFPGLTRWAGTRKEKPIRILLKQDTVSGSGISWAVCKSAPRSRQIATPAPHHSVFYRLDALPAAQPTASKHWRDGTTNYELILVLVTTSCPSSRGWPAWSCDLLTGAWLNSRLISWVAWVLACLV